MGIFHYIKENGIKHVLDVVWQYKADRLIRKVMLLFLNKKPLKDIIVIESHNDFDCNGGAFYDFLLKHKYNKRYKIVWLLKNKHSGPLPENVVSVPLFKPSFQKDYYICMAKYLLADNTVTEKMREGQRSFYLTHGSCALKNVKGKMRISDSVDYILTPSEDYAPILADQFSLPYPSERLVYIGYPVHDILYDTDISEISKVTERGYRKVIIWMPTFRKGTSYKRNDSTRIQKLGIPLIEEFEEYKELDRFLCERDVLMIIKIHPMQDLTTLGISDTPNIKVLTGISVKEKNIDNYRLIKCSDAMISDYSSVAFEYLQLNRPLAYVLEDAKDYKLGFVVEDIHKLLAGELIYKLDDMKKFICNVTDGVDLYQERRERLRDYVFKYHDGNSCRRLADFMGLKN